MKTAVITTGGLGSRLLTYTRTNPKTMLPLFHNTKYEKEPMLRPLIETIFENLYDHGFRKFCIIIGGKTKSRIINHMKVDKGYLQLLKKRNATADKRFTKTLEGFYKKLDDSKINWITQNTPMGFGHALLSARKYVKDDSFLLHTGDVFFPDYDFLPKVMKRYSNAKNASGLLFLQRKKELRGYGIAQTKNGLVFDVEEKPKRPKSNITILPLYFFKTEIFDALKATSKGYNNELQVTDAIKTMLDWEKNILGEFYTTKKWYDIGTPKNYLLALNHSFKNSNN
tara:strand:+ start:334 stop:1182 length:849 start_codon:yes stop_codon:yes gene_type:complete